MNGLALPARLVPPKRAYVFLATAALATLVALTIAASAARAAVVFDGSPGTAAPPATLGPHTMTPFASDARPVLADVSSVPSPLGGSLGFTPALNHRTIGNGWASWSHGYTGDVYYSNGATSVTMTMPAGTKAFYFYAEPNPFAVFDITATTNTGVTSGPIPVDGTGGATYFGFYTGLNPFETIATINVSSLILAEVGLSYFGFGVQPPDVSLGSLIGDYAGAALTFPWEFYFPVGFLIVLVLAINLVGDGLRDAFDPNQGVAK